MKVISTALRGWLVEEQNKNKNNKNNKNNKMKKRENAITKTLDCCGCNEDFLFVLLSFFKNAHRL